VSAIETFDGELDEASGPMSSTLRLREDVDVSRGDLVCRANNQPAVVCELDAMVCRMSQQPLVAGRRFGVKHTTRTVKAVASEIVYRIDVNRLHREESATEPRLNDIGRVRLRLAAPLAVDAYRRNRSTGSFILIDGATTETSGAAMVLQPTGAQVVV
jgi:bifunctional enzyme CysN/CysC